MNDECIILCGGEGKRLRPFTQNIPKALVKIKGKSLLKRKIEYLKSQGIKRIILATGYLNRKIQEEIIKIKSGDVSIIFSQEKELLGTGGAVKNALKHIQNNDFFVTNVDDLHDVNLKKLARFKQPTLALRHYKCNFGVVRTSGNEVIFFEEKPILPDIWVSIGTYYLNKSIKYPEKGSLEKDVFPNIPLKVHKHEGEWIAINTLKDIEEAEESKWLK